MYYNEAQGPLEVELPATLDLVGSNQFLSYPQWLCHSFKGCALPPSLLSQYEYTVVGKATFSTNLKAHKSKIITYVSMYTFFISDYLQSFLNLVNKITFTWSLTYDSLSTQ